ncbi:MAG: RHS repeat-associated core domain-containing protein [Acholeplasmatales bacterium]
MINWKCIKQKSFTYNSKNELLTQNYYENGNLINSWTYTYDLIGNLVNKKVTTSYGEANFNHTFEGSKLKQVSIPEAGVGFTYKYNDEGVRIFKNNYGTYYYYTVLGNKVLKETWGNNTILYTYDVDGSLISFNYNGVEYFYVKNSLNDIIKIVNSSGSILVTYDYDAYGNIINVTDNSGINLSYINPYRYRSYRYDNETGYYYLNQRYYDPSIGRFISRDDVGYVDPNDSRGLNLYAYCMNNPIMYVDPDGESIVLTAMIIGAIIGAAIGFGAVAYIDYIDDGQIFNGSVCWTEYALATSIGAVAGALIGGLAVTPIPFTYPTLVFLQNASTGTMMISVVAGTATVSGAVAASGTAALVGAGAYYMFSKGRPKDNTKQNEQFRSIMNELGIKKSDPRWRKMHDLTKKEPPMSYQELKKFIMEELGFI